jgi:hypothetical protein
LAEDRIPQRTFFDVVMARAPSLLARRMDLRPARLQEAIAASPGRHAAC